jgi:hypothetical protein
MPTRAALLLCLTLAAFIPKGVESQTPGVYLYFDNQHTVACKNCPIVPIGTLMDTLYVVLDGFNEHLSSLEYSIDYPLQLLWLGDMWTSGSAIGNSPTGILHKWATPLDATGSVLVAKVVTIWFCNDCSGGSSASMCVEPHPDTGVLAAKQSPDGHKIYPYGHGLVICPSTGCDPAPCTSPPSPVEQSTWGKIKELYDAR